MSRLRGAVSDLACIRANKALSLEQIARATRISLCYLRAIENGDVEKLPGGVYTRSYLRQYARAIDYDEGDLLRRFGLPENERPAARQDEAISRPGLLGRLIHAIAHAGLTTTGAKRTG